MSRTTYERLTAVALYDEQPSASERAKKKQHLPKDRPVSDRPSSRNLVSRAYENVLFVEIMPSRYRGLASVFGLFLFVGAILGYWGTKLGVEIGLLIWAKRGFGWSLIAQGGLTVGVLALVLIALIAAIRAFRIDLLAPKEIPLIFNRKTRKVYRFVQDVPGFEQLAGPDGRFRLLGLLKYIAMTFLPWPNMLLIEYDWDCLEAEYYSVTALAGNVVRTDDHLDLYVKESPASDKVIGSFALTPSILAGGEQQAKNLWEHVRRFMEENGPPLAPGDQPAPPPPRGFWQAANAPFNGPGWLFFLVGAIWTAKDVYWHVLGLLLRDVIPNDLWVQAIRYPFPGIVRSFVIFFSYFCMTWVFFAVLAGYLSKHADLPDELTADAGARVDLKKFAEASPTPAGG
jgi:hypothetical protein